MLGLTNKKDAEKAQEQLGKISALFGEAGKAEGFNPAKAVEGLISLRDGIQRVANLFGDKAKAEGFSLPNAVKSSLDTNADVRKAFGEAANAEGFKLPDAVKAAVDAQNKLSKITEAYGEAAKDEGFDVVAAVKADRKNIEETDGADRSSAQDNPPSADEKELKEFYSKTDAELDRMMNADKEA